MKAESPDRTAIFLDRDGVINRKAPEGDYVRRWEDFEFLPGSVEALQTLAAAGAALFVVTNQRGVALGSLDPRDLDDIHARMSASLASAGVDIAGIYVCPHDVDACDCRKPGTRLFLDAKAEYPWIDFGVSDLVGDSLSDLEAGDRLGMRLWLVGDEARRRDVASRAAESGMRLAGDYPSLLSLVQGVVMVPPSGAASGNSLLDPARPMRQ